MERIRPVTFVLLSWVVNLKCQATPIAWSLGRGVGQFDRCYFEDGNLFCRRVSFSVSNNECAVHIFLEVDTASDFASNDFDSGWSKGIKNCRDQLWNRFLCIAFLFVPHLRKKIYFSVRRRTCNWKNGRAWKIWEVFFRPEDNFTKYKSPAAIIFQSAIIFFFTWVFECHRQFLGQK